ncbi:hypothetical protein J2W35_003723 [Variovorax boronicumulans]|uniref:type IV toxin-antitoxin system AbiEi family antitoxin domain-containing protein n=1 Tax=Variovorax boronicumulans TaxID=436515 RepID=UPI00278BA300|nr:hypothetical protein [Variovorax boronicumulans]MDQ0083359.1 hypothetical protein [Variovorax boronicumulans]
MATRIQIAKADIVSLFENQLPHVLRLKEISLALNTNREFWRLAKSTSLNSFVQFLLEKTALKKVNLPFPNKPISGYVWGDMPLLEVLLGLIEGSYYSHYTAMRLHGLTEQVPKTLYISQEKSRNTEAYSEHDELFPQEAIDTAFRQEPRISSNQVTMGEVRVVYLTGAHRAMLGVVEEKVNYDDDDDLTLRFTNLERTLIDIAVRPFYAGGIFEVAKAFENAKGKFSVNQLVAMLKRLNFGYPYHQAIGYYLERASYKTSAVALLKKIPMGRDFYLTHGLTKTTYVKDWRLHVPEGF